MALVAPGAIPRKEFGALYEGQTLGAGRNNEKRHREYTAASEDQPVTLADALQSFEITHKRKPRGKGKKAKNSPVGGCSIPARFFLLG